MAHLAKPSSRKQQGSRPAAPPSSSLAPAPRPPYTGLRTKGSPNEVPMHSYFAGKTFSPDHNQRLSPETTRRSSAFYYRPDSKNGLSDSNANLNRWSQSTTSSKGSSAQYKRKSSLSKRLSGSLGSFGNFGNPQITPPSSKSPKRPRSPPIAFSSSTNLVSPPTEDPPPILPPIVTLSSLSKAVDDAESPSTIPAHTPATAELLSPSNEQDYFGDQWSSTSPGKLNLKKSSKPSPVSPLSPNLSQNRIPESVYSPRASTFIKHSERRHSSQRRHRANSSKSTGTTEGESSASDRRDSTQRRRKRRPPSQKALLSKALAKANHAVVLDGKQNVEGAVLAYGDACNLLRQVMVRSSGEDDRRKLEAVRNTYKSRIVELKTNDPFYASSDNKALPARPAERDSGQTELTIVTDEDEDTAGENSKAIQSSGTGSVPYNQSATSRPYIPPRRQSLHSSTYRVEGRDLGATPYDRKDEAPYDYDSAFRHQVPMHQEYMPPPLTTRRQPSPVRFAEDAKLDDEPESVREGDDGHTSWLNTINESSGSSASSVHSRRSSIGLRRKRIRAASGATETDFNAALDAAIETAYDDGFEPDDEADDDGDGLNDDQYPIDQPDPLSTIRRNIEVAKENVREAEREAAVAQAQGKEKGRLQNLTVQRDSIDDDFGDYEGDEEERLLEEMTRGFVLGDAEFDEQTKSALPRQSDSSGFSGRTMGSSFGSNPTTAGTSLSTVAEASALPSLASKLQTNSLPPLMHPPPSGALPPPPAPTDRSSAPSDSTPRILAARNASPGVRERRLSGLKLKQLKIETNTKAFAPVPDAPKTQPPPVPAPIVFSNSIPEPPQPAFIAEDTQQIFSSPMIQEPSPTSATLPPSRNGSFPFVGSDAGDQGSTTTGRLTKVTSADSDTLATSLPSSPARLTSKGATGLRKNFSSSSLRSKALSINDDTSPNTSVSSISSTPKSRPAASPAVPVLPTPLESSFLPKAQPMGGIHLFDCEIHSPRSPGSPNPLANNPPLPLEPCPESPLLRPFWFLRTIYQTIVHPRGGYITNRLFVPRDIWRVKNLKLKNVEEKVSTCDLLTAALLKLGKVDTYNADAVLEEMQFLENVMERAQTNLAKKLGNEVGLQGSLQAFRGVNLAEESTSNSEALNPTSASSNKSYLKSWRKLRSKNSVGPSTVMASGVNSSKTDLRDAPAMQSLPISSSQNPRFPKRDISQVQCMGPNPSYMGALARLCDAVQILDQVARQAEDPGLKHSSPTHVGLELCIRHAAEFFGFYICRFVLADISLMLDKFIKRSSEWVLT
ncbi:uncharacterized protein KY384_002443 [Bacidia gigantensis]|uniref:uncharacterized protein n=1 Tax=Bacidia gigantensis TaxID=2732470 RepID=UPI001D04953B|nr:uncharacterized protein KY384_002443 [Bacidia gigantensis]KAG8532566.1 hypothetical protein KY384_002443 [Bacidia gigantensis]